MSSIAPVHETVAKYLTEFFRGLATAGLNEAADPERCANQFIHSLRGDLYLQNRAEPDPARDRERAQPAYRLRGRYLPRRHPQERKHRIEARTPSADLRETDRIFRDRMALAGTTERSMSGSDWLLVLLSIVWGGSFFFAKIAGLGIARRSPSCSAACPSRRRRCIW